MTASRRSALLALAGVALILGVVPLVSTRSAAAQALTARSSDADGVRVVVTPKTVTAGSAWEFEVVMDTHTKPLDIDLAQTSVLVDSTGRSYRPLAWQGDPPGSHHRKGVLRFPAPEQRLGRIELQIEEAGGVGKRNFQWDLK